MPENVFQGNPDPAELAKVDIGAPLTNAKTPSCEYYLEAYRRAAQQAKEKGNVAAAVLYDFLARICSFRLSVDTPAKPYFQIVGNLSVPDSLSEVDLSVVRELSNLTNDDALRARLRDLLWERTKDHKAGVAAVVDYIASAKRLEALNKPTFAVEQFHRAIQLALKFGRDKKAFKAAESALIDAARQAGSGSTKYYCCNLMWVMLSTFVGDPVEFASIAASIAVANERKQNFPLARAYREAEAEWHKRTNNGEAEKNARLAAAETYIVDAVSRTKGKGASYMIAATLLGQGIEALRRAGATKSRINKLRKILDEYNKKSLSEFRTHEYLVDLSSQVKLARAHVKTKSFHEAAIRLAFGQKLTDLAALRKEVLQAINDYPMQFLMQRVQIYSKGRTQHVRGYPSSSDSEVSERILEEDMFDHAARYHWSLRNSGFIEPARIQVLYDWHPTFRDLASIVINNPFVPPGHEEIFLRGIHAGFHGDFVIASHLLVPQIENSLRYVLESSGVDVSNLMGDGTQPVKILGGLLEMSETKEIFEVEFCFELRGCLIEKTGYDFRNRVAHGFVSTADCHSHASRMIWWLVLRLCLTPAFHECMRQGGRKRRKSG